MTQVFEGVLLWFQTWLTEFMIGILTAVLGLTAVGCVVERRGNTTDTITIGSPFTISRNENCNPLPGQDRCITELKIPWAESVVDAVTLKWLAPDEPEPGPPAPEPEPEPEPTPEPVTP